eukprot:TRINITY_DN3740_c0_g1_i2.p1 TRINITY_DN3740_c0_g1~~TRINITY_DN3740_c0_g1_i2.p1  ORF type:complete len:962 (-),score=248.45 TRINITY_DN3740_c0_g1_i2:73-2958(-)
MWFDLSLTMILAPTLETPGALFLIVSPSNPNPFAIYGNTDPVVPVFFRQDAPPKQLSAENVQIFLNAVRRNILDAKLLLQLQLNEEQGSSVECCGNLWISQNLEWCVVHNGVFSRYSFRTERVITVDLLNAQVTSAPGKKLPRTTAPDIFVSHHKRDETESFQFLISVFPSSGAGTAAATAPTASHTLVTCDNMGDCARWMLALSQHKKHLENRLAACHYFCRGWLSKKPKSFTFRQKETIWAEVSSGVLRFFSSPLEGCAQQSVDLADLSVKPLNDSVSFEIQLNDLSTLTFVAPTAAERSEWLGKIQSGSLAESQLSAKKNSVVREGYLHKRKNTKAPLSLLRDHKFYWFVLTRSSLRYYRSRSDTELKRVIDLSQARLNLPVNSSTDFCFELCLPGKILRLVAANREEYNNWIIDLTAVMTHQTTTDLSAKPSGPSPKKRRHIEISGSSRKISQALYTPPRKRARTEETEQKQHDSAESVQNFQEDRESNRGDANSDTVNSDSEKEDEETTAGKRRRSLDLSASQRHIDPVSVIVIENGSEFLRIGFAGEDVPLAVIRSAVFYNESGEAVCCGDEAAAKIVDLGAREGVVSHPLHSKGEVDVSGLLDLYSLVFAFLGIDPTNRTVLLTSTPGMSPEKRPEILRGLFSRFGIEAACIANPAPMVLFVNVAHTGLAVMVGARITIVPVFEGMPIEAATVTVPFGSREVCSFLLKLLRTESDAHIPRPQEQVELARLLPLCYVAHDFEAEMARAQAAPPAPLAAMTHLLEQERPTAAPAAAEVVRPMIRVSLEAERAPPSEAEKEAALQRRNVPRVTAEAPAPAARPVYVVHRLALGQQLTLASQLFRAPEMLFNPAHGGYDGYEGLAELVVKSVELCDSTMRTQLYNNIFLAGGASLFHGLPERLARDVQRIVSRTKKESVRVSVAARHNRRYAAWCGGSVYAQTEFMTDNLAYADEFGA